ncbi:MAG: sulfite exporter TauE/SafE family protein [Propionibacteriaceae bacterium]|nr:sulfite exporter TauE/SafE family protein [Propionibacteriaceae bacterium]
MTLTSATTNGRRDVVVLVVVGLLAGWLSGFFGIGGGTVIVPALVWIGFNQRQAAATSLAAIVPTAAAAAISYIIGGQVDWVAAGLLIIGVIAGARIGSALLSRLPETVLRWSFVVFLAVVAASQFFFVPQRETTIPLTWLLALGIIVLGVATGILSGVLGVGGGIVIVSALSFFFGASDLTARGTSLVMMIPNAAIGTVTNRRKGLVNLKAGLLIGLPAIVATPLGVWCAQLLTPRINTVLFGVYISLLVIRSLFVAIRPRPPAADNTDSAA